jgi:prepilin-type N-terminal cleavage/methylation domain-containing protein
MFLILRKNNHSAFTLIELLVVIAIIALLATFSVIALNSARAKARDAKRLADIKNISTALDMYYNENGVYPVSPTSSGIITNLCFSNIGITSTCGETVYIGDLPGDPIGDSEYSYMPTDDRLDYALTFTMEIGTAGYEAGDYTATPDGIIATIRSSNWVYVGDSTGFSSNQVVMMSLTFDNDGMPYVAYRSDEQIYVMGYNNSWSAVGDTAAHPYTDTLSLAFDNENNPYVAYVDYHNSKKAAVIKYEDSSWAYVGSTVFSSGWVSSISLAIDNNDIPYVAYSDQTNSWKATVKKYYNNNWVNVGSAGFSSSSAPFISVALDNNDVPYVVYMDDANSSKVTVKKFDNNNWVNVGSAGFSDGFAYPSSLVFDNSNTPYVVYKDNGNNRKAIVKKFDSNDWISVGNNTGFSAGPVNAVSLAIDSNNIPYVAYGDGGVDGYDYKTTVKKFDGDDWVTVGVDKFSAGEANYISLAIDSDNIPYVAYGDVSYNQKAVVMKYDDTACVSECTDKVCGYDLCGGSCGTCGDGLMCSGGSCIEIAS